MAQTPSQVNITAVKIVLWVQDMARAVDFYKTAIGLTERFTSPGWSELTHGDTIIAMHGGGDGSTRETGLSFQVQDLDAACTHIQAHGGLLVQPPAQRPGEPIKLATLADTDGNRLMLTQYLG
jgi:predicted enzyme related to lactoylglutathione lyase